VAVVVVTRALGSSCLRIGRDVVVRCSDPLTVEHTWDGRPEIVGASAKTTLYLEVSDQRR